MFDIQGKFVVYTPMFMLQKMVSIITLYSFTKENYQKNTVLQA